MSSITEIVAKIGKIGVARSNRFMISFSGNCPIPSMEANRRFAFMCSGASIPAKTFNGGSYSYYGGPSIQYPYERSVGGEITLTFNLGKDMFERLFFEVWQTRIQNPKSRSFKYPDSYQSDVIIYQLDTNDNLLYCVKLIHAWPKTIGPLEYAFSQTEHHSQTITLSFDNMIYGIPIPRNAPEEISTIAWEGDEWSESFGIIDPKVDVETSKDTNFYARILEASANAGKVLYKNPSDWLGAGSILIAQGTPDYYNSLNIFNKILGNRSAQEQTGLPVFGGIIPGF